MGVEGRIVALMMTEREGARVETVRQELQVTEACKLITVIKAQQP